MTIETITLTKTSGFPVRNLQFTKELLSINEINDTDIKLGIDTTLALTEVQKSALQTLLTAHVAVFEKSVFISMPELYSLLFYTEIGAIGADEGLGRLLQSINIRLNQLELTADFTDKFFSICMMNNIAPLTTIIGVNITNKEFTIAGDLRAYFSIMPQFFVESSTGNNGWYTNNGVVLSGGNTVITVLEIIIDETVDGTIRGPVLSNISQQKIITKLQEKGLDIS